MLLCPATRALQLTLIFASLLATPTRLRAVTLEFLLSVPDATHNRLNVVVTPGNLSPDDEDSDVTGLLVADLSLQVTGSDVGVSALTLRDKPLEPDQRLLEFSDVHFTYELGFTIDGTGLGGSVTTIVDPPNTPPSIVTGGQFDAAGQQLTIDRGLFTASFGDPQDMSEVPFTGSSGGIGSIDLSETGRVGSQVHYDVVLTLSVAVNDTVPAAIPVTMQVKGTLQGFAAWTYYGADFDHDLDVDGTDFLTWQRGVGLQGAVAPTDGDANLDNQVDALDLAAWRDQFGTSPASSASMVAPIPEPGTVVLALIMGSLLVWPERGEGVRCKFSACASMGL